MGSKNEDVKEIFIDSLDGLAAKFYDKGIFRPVQHLDKLLNHNGDWVEKRSILYLVVTLQLF
jgi:hypothetical protein